MAEKNETNEKMKNIDVCQDQEGRNGRGVMWCMWWMLMHFQSISFSDERSFFEFLNWYYVYIAKLLTSLFYSILELLPTWWDFWIIIQKIFSITISGYDSDTKKLLNVSDICFRIKFLWHLADFKTCLRHVWDKFNTFPTKLGDYCPNKPHCGGSCKGDCTGVCDLINTPLWQQVKRRASMGKC